MWAYVMVVTGDNAFRIMTAQNVRTTTPCGTFGFSATFNTRTTLL